jgi:hypothetical protein
LNTFNRVVLILLCVALVVAAVAIIFLTWTIPNRSINWLQEAVEWMDANDGDLEKALLTTAAGFVGLVALIVLIVELLPRSGPDVKVTDLNVGNATLSTAAIGQRVEEAVRQVPDVSEVRANVKAKRHGVLLGLDLQVSPDANLATVTDESLRVAQEVLTERVHVALAKPPTAKLHYRELRMAGRGGDRRLPMTRTPIAPPREPASSLQRPGAGDQPEEARMVPIAPPPEPPNLPRTSEHKDAGQEPSPPPEEKPPNEDTAVASTVGDEEEKPAGA